MSSYYMKESTYRHDFGAAKDSNFTRPFPQTYYNTEEMNQRLYQPRPRRARDDTRIPMDQGRGYNDHRQEGPYTDRGGYYDRRYQEDHHYNDGAYTDRPRYDRRDDMNGPSDRGYDRRPDDRDRGAYTDRGGYERRDMNGPDRRFERPPERDVSPDRRRFNDQPSSYNDAQLQDKYGNRTTQKDYGDFSQRTRGQMDKPKPYRGEIDKEVNYNNMQHNNDASRIVPRLKDDFDYEYDFNDVDIPESSRLKGYYRFKQIPYHNRMLLNDNYDKISPPGAAQHKKDYNRIEMHEGNFKPYASHAYHTHLTNRNPTPRDIEQPETPDVPRDKDGRYIDDIYLRPEEKQVRHRNMEFEYDTQQRLPLNIAPQTDYKSNIQRPARSESGAYLFIRTPKDAMFDIKRSFQRHKSILKMSGHLKGIATPDKISVMGDFTNWHIKSPMIRKGDYWYEQTGSRNEEYATDYVILCLWFPSVDQAKTWVHYDVDFKISSFPEPYGVELLILPINYIPMNDIECSTYVMTEYPEVLNKQALNKYVKEPMEDLLTKDSKYQRGEPFVVWTDRIVNERGMWTTSRTMVAVHRFNSLNQAREFYNDPRIENMRRELKDITKGGRHTTVMFQLVDFV
ncbi:uncharacterized protein [Mytilus edulis]|uniref:uncharacterized protein isoform X4 n=1 Tax=Mytilus edulis TaxID=6550 RepID=UPI0039F05EED